MSDDEEVRAHRLSPALGAILGLGVWGLAALGLALGQVEGVPAALVVGSFVLLGPGVALALAVGRASGAMSLALVLGGGLAVAAVVAHAAILIGSYDPAAAVAVEAAVVAGLVIVRRWTA